MISRNHSDWMGHIFRFICGWLIIPTWNTVFSSHFSEFAFVIYFAICLLLLRVVPAVIRKAFPFPPHLQETWGRRRQIAKKFDSYQWRKLLWISFGFGMFLASSHIGTNTQKIMFFGSLFVGLVGSLCWFHAVRTDPLLKEVAQPPRP
jgi:hypothetical protein